MLYTSNLSGHRQAYQKMPSIILASSSRYRQQLLEKLNLPFRSFSPDIDESRFDQEKPAAMATRLAESKALVTAKKFKQHLIIASDQVACLDDRILHKPGNRSRAIEQLQRQSGRQVTFYTAVSVYDSSRDIMKSDLDTCVVHFRELSRQQIEHYVDKEHPFDCAGSFKSEALGIALLKKINGDDPNALIGLPLIKLVTLLEQSGVQIL